jgi:hypothetical protein
MKKTFLILFVTLLVLAACGENLTRGKDYSIEDFEQGMDLTFKYIIKWHSKPNWWGLSEKMAIDLSYERKYHDRMVTVQLYSTPDSDPPYGKLKTRDYARNGKLLGN